MKKILFVTRPLCAPWDEASKNFAFDLAQNVINHTLTILTHGTLVHARKNLTCIPLYTSAHFDLSQKIKLLWFLIRHGREFDIIHLLFTPTKLNSWIMQKILPRNVRVIQTVATLREDLYEDNDLKKLFFGDTIVTYSAYAKKKLSQIGIQNTMHIYPGINLKKFTPEPAPPDLLKLWHIRHPDLIVTYPGEFVRLGATDLIFDTFLKIWENPQNHHIKYLCACRIKNNADALKKNELVAKFEAVGHRDKVIFTDTFSDMNAIYNLSNIIIFPVTNMAGKFDVPLAIIEPYACRKPVITSDLSLFGEFSSDEINVIIPRNSISALADAILALDADTECRKDLGDNAFTFVHKTFDITNIAQSYTKLYDTI